MKKVAILGSTASGKTSLSIKLAKRFNANILSLDSLSIYKEIDIASAKPTPQERDGIVHYGIDEIFPNNNFNVSIFFDIYKKAYEESRKEDKNLIIVGGTGFYLKSLLSGLSQRPLIAEETKCKVKRLLMDKKGAFEIVQKSDEEYAKKISPNDTYRIEKWLEIYLQSGMSASRYFNNYRQEPIIKNIDIFEIELPKESLKGRIELRTKSMLESGLIDEVVYLEKNYTRAPNSMKSIGIKETLEFLDGLLSRDELANKISQNTIKLAKRQRTFNSTQLPKHKKGDSNTIYKLIDKLFNR